MTSPENGEELTFPVEVDNLRIDLLLARKFKDQSRSYFQKLIDGGFVSLNGTKPKKQTRPKLGDTITVSFELNQEIRLDPEEIPINIVYEDDHFICINKVPGMVVHPAPGNWNGTLANALLYHFNNLPGSDSLRPGIVHRLDKDTSGLILVAKTPECHRKFVEIFSSRQIKKMYLAISWGKPKENVFSGNIGRHPKDRKKQIMFDTDTMGRHSHTDLEILERNENYTLLRALPLTGRTHQIRVHLQALHAPILGDPQYGSRTANQKHPNTRLQLHAHELKFAHPITDEAMHLKAPLPADMLKLIHHLFEKDYA